MTALPLLLVVRALFAVEESPGSAPPAGGEVVIFLAPRQGGGPSAAALSEAVATYTRDLRLTLQTVASDKVEPTPATIDRVTALVRARRARLAFWCVPSSDGRTIVLHWLDVRGAIHKEAVPLGEREGADVHRAVALKLRAILTPESSRQGTERATESREGEAARAALGPADAPSAAPAAAAARDEKAPNKAPLPPAKPAPPPEAPPVAAAGTPAVVVASAPAAPTEIADWAVALGYAGASFSGATDIRHGLGAQVVHGVGSSGEGEIFAGLEVGLPVDRTVTAGAVAGSISVFDVPLRAGARLTPVRSTVVLGGGAFGAAHVLAAGANAAGGASDQQVALAVGGGVELLARLPTSWNVSWELRAWGEALVPRTRFLLRGTPGAETGRFAAGVALGLVFPSR